MRVTVAPGRVRLSTGPWSYAEPLGAVASELTSRVAFDSLGLAGTRLRFGTDDTYRGVNRVDGA